MQQLEDQIDIFNHLIKDTTHSSNAEAGEVSLPPYPPPHFFHGWSLWLQLCVTHLISANYTQAQSLIQAVDIEQPAVVNYFFTILPGKAAQTPVKQRSVSLKSIHPGPRAPTSRIHRYNRHELIILFSWSGRDWRSGCELLFRFPWNATWMESCHTQHRIRSGFSCKRKRHFLCGQLLVLMSNSTLLPAAQLLI